MSNISQDSIESDASCKVIEKEKVISSKLLKDKKKRYFEDIYILTNIFVKELTNLFATLVT